MTEVKVETTEGEGAAGTVASNHAKVEATMAEATREEVIIEADGGMTGGEEGVEEGVVSNIMWSQ